MFLRKINQQLKFKRGAGVDILHMGTFFPQTLNLMWYIFSPLFEQKIKPVLLIGPKIRTLVRIWTSSLNDPILVLKMGLSPILDFCKGGPFSLFRFQAKILHFFFVFKRRSCISARLPTRFKGVNQPEVRIWSEFWQS